MHFYRAELFDYFICYISLYVYLGISDISEYTWEL